MKSLTLTLTFTLAFITIALALDAPSHWIIDTYHVGRTTASYSGLMGEVKSIHNDYDLQHYIKNFVGPMFNLTGSEVFVQKQSSTDFKGNVHVKFQEYFVRDGVKIEVDGGEFLLHLRPNGTVYRMNGNILPDSATSQYSPETFLLSPSQCIDDILALYHHARIVEAPMPVVLLESEEGHNSYRVVIEYLKDDDMMKSEVHICPTTGKVLAEYPLYLPAKDRVIYSANNGVTLPGTEKRSEGQFPVIGDDEVNQAYENAGHCYDFYFQTFQRDSYDGNGAMMISTVHYREGYNNAFWNGAQMVYGDGDGVTFVDFASDLSVVCHELTHAVVEYTASLRYRDESGALNEGMADIMGSSSTVFVDNGVISPSTWEIGDKCYLAGSALRYMANPVEDGVSTDYYPDRYTGFLDNGGVHWNSGIANLFYVLLVQGGVHPQQKTSIFVTPVGIDVAQQVVYAALKNYMMMTTTFAQAASDCITAANDLYGDNPQVAQSVRDAWAAVGVTPSEGFIRRHF